MMFAAYVSIIASMASIGYFYYADVIADRA